MNKKPNTSRIYAIALLIAKGIYKKCLELINSTKYKVNNISTTTSSKAIDSPYIYEDVRIADGINLQAYLVKNEPVISITSSFGPESIEIRYISFDKVNMILSDLKGFLRNNTNNFQGQYDSILVCLSRWQGKIRIKLYDNGQLFAAGEDPIGTMPRNLSIAEGVIGKLRTRSESPTQ